VDRLDRGSPELSGFRRPGDDDEEKFIVEVEEQW
jgi:hypothetical protein